MQGVLISIQPKWCELIASGKKTVEVRKTKPKLETPFRVYVYCTKNKEKLIDVIHDGDDMGDFVHRGKPNFIKTYDKDWSLYGVFKGGKVIGEFVCHNISEFESELWDDETYERITRVVHTEDWEGYPETESYYVAEDGEDNYLCRQSCLTWEDLRGYVGQDINTFFGWHISDLKIYDKPRALREFKRFVDRSKGQRYHEDMLYLQRPPQSWCYVEVQG